MPAYIVFIKEREHDAEAMSSYSQAVRASVPGHELKPLSMYGRVESLEGPPVEGVVLLEFPSLDAARAWYRCDKYQEARKHRFQGADYRAFIVEGT